MARKSTPALNRLRRLLLFGFVAFVLALGALYMFGRQAPTNALQPVSDDRAPSGPEVVIGTKFHYEVTEDGEKLWEIDADRLVSDESGRYVLDGVSMTMEQEDGRQYTISSDRGVYRLEDNEATLTGQVELVGSNGLTLSTEGLELRNKGRIVVSTGPVSIQFGDSYHGRSDRLEVHFPKNRITLAGKVLISTPPGSYPAASISGRRVLFFRDTHNFRAEGRVVLRREGDTLKARRLSINFDEADKIILYALATWDVEATFAQLASAVVPSTAGLSGDQLSVVFNEVSGDPERLEVDAPDGGLAQLRVADESGLERTMKADYLWATFNAGRLSAAQGLGGVAIEERFSHSPSTLVRQICSESAQALYDTSGEMTELALAGAVDYLEPDLQATGDTLTATEGGSTVDLVGDLAWIASSQGRLEAPRIEMERAEKVARATGGVRAELADRSSPELAKSDQAAGPVRIEAEQALWTGDPQSFEFQQSVRAWQGENFLVSQKLGLDDGDLVASGGVRSVWHKRSPATEVAAAIDPQNTAGEQPEEEPPVQISSSTMRYQKEVGRLIYEGSARIVQGGRSMSCPYLQLQLDDNDDFERMYCEAGTSIVDGEGGNRLNGNAAVYNTRAGKVKILGEPARMTQGEGGTISARLMVYDFDTGIAEIDSVKDEEADLFKSAAEYWAAKAPPPPPAVDPIDPADLADPTAPPGPVAPPMAPAEPEGPEGAVEVLPVSSADEDPPS